MRRPVTVLLLVLGGLGACGKRGGSGDQQETVAGEAPALVAVGDQAGIAMDSAERARLGIRLDEVRRATQGPERELPAVVVENPGAGTTVRASVAGRLTVAEGTEWPAIGDRLEEGRLVAQVGDARPLAVPRAGTVTRLLAQPGELVQAGQALLELTDYGRPLASVPWDGTGAPPARMSFRLTSGGARIEGTREGPAPEADPVTRLPAFRYLLPPRDVLRPGVGLVALVPGAEVPAGAVRVPTEAVVQWDALAWAYVELEPDRLVRVRVPTDRPVSGGWLVAGGIGPGDRVVVQGAGQLLSEEFRSRITVGEEVGE